MYDRAAHLKLIERHRRRESYHRAWLKLEQQVGAICRRFTESPGPRDKKQKKSPEADALKKKLEAQFRKESRATAKGDTIILSNEVREEYTFCFPLFLARQPVRKHRDMLEREMVKIAAELPAYDWAMRTPGLGAFCFAQLVAEAGHLCEYQRPALLWRRFGVGFVRVEHEDETVSHLPQLLTTNKALAIAFGRSQRRRTILFRTGDCAAVKRTDSSYGKLYRERKAYEQVRAKRDGVQILPQEKANQARKVGRTVFSLQQIDFRARRYTEKRILLDLWVEWRKACSCEIAKAAAA